MNKPKIVFFGTDGFVIAPLRVLLETGCDVLAVVIAFSHSPVGQYAAKQGLRVFTPQSLKDDDFFLEFKQLKPDLCVVASYGKIIPQRYLDVPQFGFLNLHPSLLPKYRGPSPVPATLLAGDTVTGMTVIKMDAEMDHGPIVAQQKVPIEPDDNFTTLIHKLFGIGAELLTEVINGMIYHNIIPEAQEESLATYTKLLKTKDAEITQNDSVELAMRKIRALNPEPGTFIYLESRSNNKEFRIKILEAEKTEQYDNKKPILKLRDGDLLLIKVQPEGKRIMSGEAFWAGYKNKTAL